MSSCSTNADMETSTSLINVITDNILFHSGSYINQMLPQTVHILRDRHLVPDFVVNWIRSGLFGGHKSESLYGIYDMIAEITALLDCRQGSE